MSITEKRDCFVTKAKAGYEATTFQSERHYPKLGLCEILKAKRLEIRSHVIPEFYSPWNRRPDPANRIWKNGAPAE